MTRARLLTIYIITEVAFFVLILWSIIISSGGIATGVATIFFSVVNGITSILYLIGSRKHLRGSTSIYTYLWTFGIYFLLNALMIVGMVHDIILKLSQ